MTPEKETGVATATELHADLLRMSGAEPDSRMGKAIVALIAAVRAETLEEQAQALEDDGIAMPEGDVQLALARHCRRIRGMVRALVSK